jgi:DNA-binding response OmpR family regulator
MIVMMAGGDPGNPDAYDVVQMTNQYLAGWYAAYLAKLWVDQGSSVDLLLHTIDLHDVLAGEGYRVLTAPDGESGLQRAIDEKPDLILLDIMMPKLDGYAVCAELRRLSNPVPILMLTAKGQVEDRVQGLDVGADDYLVKPFSTEELLARVRAMLRRVQRQSRMPTTLTLGDAHVDLVRQTAARGRTTLHLTAKEFAMLRLMAESPGEPVSRERFLDVVWGYTAFPTTRTVDTHMANLRSKIEPDPEAPRWLLTVHGIGYKLEAPPAGT